MSKNTRQRVFGDDATDAKTRLPRLEDPCNEAWWLTSYNHLPSSQQVYSVFSNEHRNITLSIKDGYIPPHRSAIGQSSEQCQSTLVQYKFKSRGSSGSQTTGSSWSWTNGRHIQTHAGFRDKHRRLIQGDQGLGIALVAAQKAKVPVTLVDTSQASLDKGMKFAGTRSSKDEYFSLPC